MATCSPGIRQIKKRADHSMLELSARLRSCWANTFEFKLIPDNLAKVCCLPVTNTIKVILLHFVFKSNHVAYSASWESSKHAC